MTVPRNLLLSSLIALVAVSCDSQRGKSRELQLEKTAEELEAKAEKVLHEVEKSADEKIAEAKEIRKVNGDNETAKVLEKDASVTREVGKLRAEQLEKQAGKVREQAKDANEDALEKK